VGATLRSYGYGGAGLRLHWARRGPSPDGAALVRAAAEPAGGEGEDAAAAGEGSTTKGVAVESSKAKVYSLHSWHTCAIPFCCA
jgi:starch synthase